MLVDFDDGSRRDFSSDPRTSITIPAQYAACAQLNGRTLAVLPGATCAQVAISVSVPSVAAALSATASVTVMVMGAWAVQGGICPPGFGRP